MGTWGGTGGEKHYGQREGCLRKVEEREEEEEEEEEYCADGEDEGGGT